MPTKKAPNSFLLAMVAAACGAIGHAVAETFFLWLFTPKDEKEKKKKKETKS